MSENARIKIADEFRLLFQVPKSAIIDFLIQHQEVGEPLELALGSVCGIGLPLAATDLARCSFSDVVRVVQQCSAFTADHVVYLHNQYLYRGMKTLYLYELMGTSEVPTRLSLPDLNRQLAEVKEELKQHAANLPDPEFRDIGTIESPVGQMYELSYAYVATIQVVNPITEYPELVEDLRRGFVWLSPQHAWMAVCARDQVMNRIISRAVARYIRCLARAIVIPKSVLKKLESSESIRRLSVVDQMTNTRRRWTNADMASDNRAMEEIQQHDGDMQTACGYNQELPDGTAFALGYSNTQGRVFFSRDLTVSQMRAWGPEKINHLILSFRETRASEPFQILPDISDQVLRYVPKDTRQAMIEIAQALIVCKTNGASEADLASDALAIYASLRGYADCHFLADCPYCQEPTEIKCAGCEGSSFAVQDGSIVCQDCGTVVACEDVRCVEDHTFMVDDEAELLTLTPKRNLFESVKGLVEAAGQRFNSVKEHLQIRGSRVYYSLPGGQAIYCIEDIPELLGLLTEPASGPQDIVKALGVFREKCEKSSIEACSQCVSHRQGGPCYLRLFGLFDPDYVPYPHQGNEFGDYSRIVTIDGQQQQLVVAMKKGKPSNRTVTLRSGLGQDIYTQIRGYLADARVDILGISVPRRLDQSLIATLRTDAESRRKKILIMDDEALARIVHSVMMRHELAIEDI